MKVRVELVREGMGQMNQWKKKIIAMCMSATMLIGSVGVMAQDSGTMTREDFAAKLVGELGYKGIAKAYDKTNPFSDVVTNKGAVQVVSSLGIMNGVADGKFDPKGIVTKENEKRIRQRTQEQLGQEVGWKHGFYATDSYGQIDKIKLLDAVSFGWSQVQYDPTGGGFTVNTQDKSKGGFTVPDQFHIPMDLAKASGVETYLMVFFEDKEGRAKKLLMDQGASAKLVGELVDLCNGLTKDGETRAFDGITIDFENFIAPELKSPYNTFLKSLDTALEQSGKKLNVAVPPGKYFKGYDYRSIGEMADRVILMAHDYAPKKLAPLEMEVGRVHTPLTPIDNVYRDLQEVISPQTGVADKNKVILQIAFASTQWQTKGDKVLNQYPYTPGYDKIQARLGQPGVKIGYDELAQNPYATYTQNGINNMIWYENEKSVDAKVNLAKLLGIGGISYWRLGTMPEFVK